ncbi:MAG: VWA domain-containing protein [Thermoanaerobaculia bacterium]
MSASNRLTTPGVLLAALLSVQPSSAQDTTTMAAQGRNLIRASRLLDSGEPVSGDLEVRAELMIADDFTARLAVRVPRVDLPEAGSRWILTLVAPAVDSETLTRSEVLEWRQGLAGTGWAYDVEVEMPQDFQDAAVAVEDLVTGSWGAVLVELTDEIPSPGTGLALLGDGPPPAAPARRESGSSARVPLPTPYEPRRPQPRATPPATGSADDVIKLIPPAARPALGKVRFRTVVTMEGIRSAVFYLDDAEVATDPRPPFTATLDLGPEARARRVRVVARGYQDVVLGSDEVIVNLDEQPFAIRIRDFSPDETGVVSVSAEVTVPPGEELERVEFYQNDTPVAALSEPPFEVAIPAGFTASDFVRVVAHLASGASLEDARLLSERVVSERIDVNLVEVYAVVSRQGHPVRDLSEPAFRLSRGRSEIPIERFAIADEVPLVLGLIIDSSESMDFLMEDTRRAAAGFVSRTLLEDDRAFLVDFDTQPRLAQGLTGDIGVLVPALGRLRVGGNTAIYDAIIYSLAQFEREPGRRALVLLTDGRDYGSRFKPKRCLQEARRLGVPVYVIAISDLLGRMPGAWMQKKPKKAPPADAFLEAFAESTGGRLFSIVGMDDLESVYSTINAELRSQYLLAFSTAAPLSAKEIDDIQVRVEGKGLTVRTVVLAR